MAWTSGKPFLTTKTVREMTDGVKDVLCDTEEQEDDKYQEQKKLQQGDLEQWDMLSLCPVLPAGAISMLSEVACLEGHQLVQEDSTK